jgi:hypothetical protein
MPNDDISLRADIADIERRMREAQKNKNYMIIEMLMGRLANRRRQLKELEDKRRSY